MVLKHPFLTEQIVDWSVILALYAISFHLYGSSPAQKFAGFLAHLSLHFRAWLCQGHNVEMAMDKEQGGGVRVGL
jgi:hypothetical protein